MIVLCCLFLIDDGIIGLVEGSLNVLVGGSPLIGVDNLSKIIYGWELEYFGIRDNDLTRRPVKTFFAKCDSLG